MPASELQNGEGAAASKCTLSSIPITILWKQTNHMGILLDEVIT